jgi:hypothetical protein
MNDPSVHRLYHHFSELPASLRVMYTSVLVLLGLGYLFALVYLFHSYSGKDGNPNSLSYEDIVIAYSGTAKGSRLEGALRGSMSVMLPHEERGVILLWLQDGTERGKYEAEVRPIVEKRCLACHDGTNPNLANLNGYDNILKVTEAEKGKGIFTLVRQSHIHLFGLTFVFFLMGTIFSHAYVRPVWFKCAIMALPFVSLLLDVSSWYFTKLYQPFGWVVMISGGFMGLAFAFMWFVSMVQMWLSKPPAAITQREARTQQDVG